MLDSKTLIETVQSLNKSGDLRRTLKKYHLKNLAIFQHGEDYTEGLNLLAITNAQYERLNNVYYDLGLGELKDYMRNCRHFEEDLHEFSTGYGYSVIDVDLLGGSGNGDVLAAFKKAGLTID